MRSHGLKHRAELERRILVRPDEANVYVWYRPDTVNGIYAVAGQQPPDGTSSPWADSSGVSGIDLAANGSPAPVWHRNRYGWGAFYYNGSTAYHYNAADPWGAGAAATMISVAEIEDGSNRSMFGSFPDRHTMSEAGAFWRMNNGVGYGTSIPTHLRQVNRRLAIRTEVYESGAPGRSYLNGALVAVAGSSPGRGLGSVGNGFALGGHNGSGGPPPNSWFRGWIAEAMIFRKALDARELAGIHAYLLWKYWGIEGEG